MYPYLKIIIITIININTSIIVYIHNFLFRSFVVSTKLTYSSSKFVLMFILYVFNTTLKNMNLITYVNITLLHIYVYVYQSITTRINVCIRVFTTIIEIHFILHVVNGIIERL